MSRVEVEVVAAEVEEDRDVEDDAVDAAHHQRVAGDLHRARLDAALDASAANSRCRSGASGVVRAVATSSPSIRVPTVPITAAGTPAR